MIGFGLVVVVLLGVSGLVGFECFFFLERVLSFGEVIVGMVDGDVAIRIFAISALGIALEGLSDFLVHERNVGVFLRVVVSGGRLLALVQSIIRTFHQLIIHLYLLSVLPISRTQCFLY